MGARVSSDTEPSPLELVEVNKEEEGISMSEPSLGRIQRNSSIELLRIIAILMIVLHHASVHSTLDVWSQPFCLKRLFFQLCNSISGEVGNALFLLISVWFLADRRIMVRDACKKIWILERELLFWSIAILIAQIIWNPVQVDYNSVLNAFFPISRNVWWYATSYALFLAILPFLSEGLRKLGQKLHAQCCIVMFVIGGLLNFIPGSSLNIGNNVLGFMYVWILFSYYRWYMERVTVKAAGIIAVTGLVVVLFWNTLMAFFWRGDGGLQSMFSEPVGRIWSLPVLMISFGLFSLCSEITFHNRAINAVASAAFGVYLITDHQYVRNILWTQLFNAYYFYNSRYAILHLLAVASATYAIASALDMIRNTLFSFTIDRHRGACFDKLWMKGTKAMKTYFQAPDNGKGSNGNAM